jgi:hypothetical protein
MLEKEHEMKLLRRVVERHGRNKSRCMMKNRLRNIVSPLTPRNYPNMRELLLLFIFSRCFLFTFFSSECVLGMVKYCHNIKFIACTSKRRQR